MDIHGKRICAVDKKVSYWAKWYSNPKNKKKWDKHRRQKYFKQTEQDRELRKFIGSLLLAEQAKLVDHIERYEKNKEKIIKKFWILKKKYSRKKR